MEVGCARLQRRLRLQQGGADVVVDLAVHALHVHEFAGIIDDVDATVVPPFDAAQSRQTRAIFLAAASEI